MSDFREEDLILEHDGKTIFGRMFLPDAAAAGKRVPLVICAHGFGGNHESCAAYARELARRGYAAYTFDFCGATNSKSGDDTHEMTIFAERQDMEDVYDELAELPYVDLNNVFLLGMSMAVPSPRSRPRERAISSRGSSCSTPPLASPATSDAHGPIPTSFPRGSASSTQRSAGPLSRKSTISTSTRSSATTPAPSSSCTA